MDLLTVAKLLPYLFTAYDTVKSLVAAATSNEDLIAKIGGLSPRIGEFLRWLGVTLFPQVNPQLQDAAAAISIFGKEFSKLAQTSLNAVSPLLGIASPKLVIDGIPGPLTQAATKAVQEALKAKDWKELIVDGFYGFKTKAAVEEFLNNVTPLTVEQSKS